MFMIQKSWCSSFFKATVIIFERLTLRLRHNRNSSTQRKHKHEEAAKKNGNLVETATLSLDKGVFGPQSLSGFGNRANKGFLGGGAQTEIGKFESGELRIPAAVCGTRLNFPVALPNSNHYRNAYQCSLVVNGQSIITLRRIKARSCCQLVILPGMQIVRASRDINPLESKSFWAKFRPRTISILNSWEFR